MERPASKTRAVADSLGEIVETGHLEIGTRMPTTVELGTLYGISATTAWRALKLLESDGVLHRRGGRGLYVRRKPSAAQALRERRTTKLEDRKEREKQ
jgi:DNA-binding GntR family transcriptional regulator